MFDHSLFAKAASISSVAMMATAFGASGARACVIPSGLVYSVACANTLNMIGTDSVYKDSNGVYQTGHQDGTGPYTSTNGSGMLPALGRDAVSSSQEEMVSGQHTGSMSAAATVGDQYIGQGLKIEDVFDGLGVVNLSAYNYVAPSLHADAFGSLSSSSTAGSGSSITSDGSAYVSDIISISARELSYVNRYQGTTLDHVHVEFTYELSGSVNTTQNADGSFGAASYGFVASIAPVAGPAIVGGVGDASDVSGSVDETLKFSYDVYPGTLYNFYAGLETHGVGTARPGDAISYSANFKDTARFVGARFYTDSSETVQLPNIDLNSQLGYDYSTLTPDTGPVAPTDVPEPGSMGTLAVGIIGLGFAIRRRRAPPPCDRTRWFIRSMPRLRLIRL